MNFRKGDEASRMVKIQAIRFHDNNFINILISRKSYKSVLVIVRFQELNRLVS